MTSKPAGQTRLLMGYRYCEEDLQPGYVEHAAGDHLPELGPDKQKAEVVIRRGDKRGALRAQAIFVFEKFEVAARLLNETREASFRAVDRSTRCFSPRGPQNLR